MTSELFDVIVVGAGIEGSATAYTLVKNGLKTLLLEQFPLPHIRGSSHGHSRITRYAYEKDFYTHMMQDAFPLWYTLAKEAGVELFRECGVLNIGKRNGGFLSSIVAAMGRHGMEFESMSNEEMGRRFPMVSYDSSYGALLDPRGGVLFSDKGLAAFQTVFKQRGGTLRDGEPVTSIIPGRPLVTVTTVKGQYRAKKVVLATGPWTSKLLKPFGISLPMKVNRVTVMYWQEKREGSHAIGRFPCLIDGREEDEKQHVYALPSYEYPGYVKVCLHTGIVVDPDKRDDVDDGWIRDKMATFVRQHLPALHSSPGIVETCLYTKTPDYNPVIDCLPQHTNIIVAAGFSGHGFKLAPAVGKAVTEMIMETTPSYLLSPFVISRFLPPSSNL